MVVRFTSGPQFKRGGEEGNWERKGKEGQGGVEMGRKEKGWRVETRRRMGLGNEGKGGEEKGR